MSRHPANCRIGKVKLHNGAELRIMPSFQERRADAAFDDLADAVEDITQRYHSELAGFILIPFTQDLTHNVHLRCYEGTLLNMASIPRWTEEVLRIYLSRRTTREMLGMDHGT